MEKLILLAIISFTIIGCFQDKNQLGMQEAKESKAIVSSEEESNDEESSDEEAYASPLDRFLDLLENNTEKSIIAFLEKALKDDPAVLRTLYPRPDGDKEGFIHCAAARASLKVIKKLVELSGGDKAIVKLESAYKVTPLHLAALRGENTIVKYFIDQGADPRASDDERSTVLHYAAKTPANVKTVASLLEGGACIEDTIDPEDGTTLLHWAVQYNNLSLVEYLLDYYSACCPGLLNNKTTDDEALTAEGLAHYLQRWNVITVFERFNKKSNKHSEIKK